MQITKYEHACVVIQEDGKKLVIDPGNMTTTFGQLEAIVAVVVTHQHGDHFDKNHLEAIIQANPDVQIFMPHDAAAQWNDPHVTPVTGGEEKLVHPFTLKFYGELHALHHESLPRPENVGVLVNDTLYHPGDSFTLPETEVPVLALPGSAPWLKVGEAIDFLTAVHPGKCFIIHDAVLSEKGRAIHVSILSQTAEKAGTAFANLLPGDSLEA
jgi:glyoxylase-like metal-dependent hydrolase (beta-lactamase superfamily II)